MVPTDDKPVSNDRAELKRRLREKAKQSRSGGSRPDSSRPDVGSLLLNAGIDDPMLLQMGMNMSKSKPSMSTVRDLMSTAQTSCANIDNESEEEEEAPPPLPAAMNTTKKEDSDDEEEAPPP